MKLDHEIPPHTCPYCGKYANTAADFNQKITAPHPGALSICIHCTRISIFTDTLSVRALTPEEKEQVRADPYIQAMVGRIQQAKFGLIF